MQPAIRRSAMRQPASARTKAFDRSSSISRIKAGIRSICLVAILVFLSPLLSRSQEVRSVDTSLATLRISEATGDLVGVAWKSPALEVIGEPRLGENFRILIPQEHYQANYFNSRDQKVSRIEVAPDGVSAPTIHSAMTARRCQSRCVIEFMSPASSFSFLLRSRIQPTASLPR